MQEDIKKAQYALTAQCVLMGLQPDVIITEIRKPKRLILSFTQDPKYPDFGRHMIKLERKLKTFLGEMTELLCETLADKNRRDVKSGRATPKMVSARNVESLE